MQGCYPLLAECGVVIAFIAERRRYIRAILRNTAETRRYIPVFARLGEYNYGVFTFVGIYRSLSANGLATNPRALRPREA